IKETTHKARTRTREMWGLRTSMYFFFVPVNYNTCAGGKKCLIKLTQDLMCFQSTACDNISPFPIFSDGNALFWHKGAMPTHFHPIPFCGRYNEMAGMQSIITQAAYWISTK
ncbi:hypothetical protein ACJX0J_040377, partial [Zea mays]